MEEKNEKTEMAETNATAELQEDFESPRTALDSFLADFQNLNEYRKAITDNNKLVAFYNSIFDLLFDGTENFVGIDYPTSCFLSIVYKLLYTKINEIQTKKNEIQNEIRFLMEVLKNQGVRGDLYKIDYTKKNEKNEIQNEIQNENNSRKRGCPKGTKKPYLIGNRYASKQTMQSNKQITENEVVVSKNENLESIQSNKTTIIMSAKNYTKETFEERHKRFYESLIPFVKDYGKVLVRQFFDYWTECNEGTYKMRFEKEKTFEVKKRIQRWSNTDGKFTSSGFGKSETNSTVVNGAQVRLYKYDEVLKFGNNETSSRRFLPLLTQDGKLYRNEYNEVMWREVPKEIYTEEYAKFIASKKE